MESLNAPFDVELTVLVRVHAPNEQAAILDASLDIGEGTIVHSEAYRVEDEKEKDVE